MDPEEFDRFIGRRLEHDAELAQLLVRLGPRRAFDGGLTFTGDGHLAPLDLTVARPVRAYARLELTDAPGHQQAFRLALAPIGSVTPTGTEAPGGSDAGLDRDIPTDAWQPVFEVLHEHHGRWVRSHPFGTRDASGGQRLAYQGWWRSDDEPGRTDTTTRIVAHARHARGSLLWIASRNGVATPGDLDKQVLIGIVETDD